MGISIVISNRVKFKVQGTIKSESGVDKPFDFYLICRRLDQEQLAAKFSDNPELSLTDYMLEIIEDWQGVRDGNEQQLPFSEDAWRQLCKIPGMAAVASRTYHAEIGAKEKN
jgi:hypothetical protein